MFPRFFAPAIRYAHRNYLLIFTQRYGQDDTEGIITTYWMQKRERPALEVFQDGTKKKCIGLRY